MPQLIPGGQGLYPYPNAGRNDFEGIGNILLGLAGGLEQYRRLKKEGRTIGDFVSRPQVSPSFTGTVREGITSPSSLREGSMSALSSLGYQNRYAGTPFDTRKQLIKQPSMISEDTDLFSNFARMHPNIKLEDVPTLSHIKNLAGPSLEDLQKKFYTNELLRQKTETFDQDEKSKEALRQSEIEKNKALLEMVPIYDQATKQIIGYTKRGTIKVDSNKDKKLNQAGIDKIQTQIDELKSVHKSLDVIHQMFNEGSRGKGAAVSRGIASKMQSMPFIPDAFFPDSANYNSLVKELTPQLALALTGSKQGLAAIGKSAGKGIPSLGFNTVSASKNFNEMKRQLAVKRMDAYNRKIKYGGEITEEDQAEISNIKNIIGGKNTINPTVVQTQVESTPDIFLRDLKEGGDRVKSNSDPIYRKRVFDVLTKEHPEKIDVLRKYFGY